jgi:hypothetical protein
LKMSRTPSGLPSGRKTVIEVPACAFGVAIWTAWHNYDDGDCVARLSGISGGQSTIRLVHTAQPDDATDASRAGEGLASELDPRLGPPG